MSDGEADRGDAGALLVLHGAHAARDDIRAAVKGLREDGHDVAVRVTWEGGHAAMFAREALEAGRRIIAGGGDGTIHEIVEAILAVSDGVPIGILPLGTANDFAASAGLPVDEVERALRLAVTGRPVPADAIRFDSRAVVNVATAGPVTRVTVETPDGLKRALGGLSYAVSGLARLPALEAQEGTVRGPDFEWSGRFLAVAIGNGVQAGGGIVLCPGAQIDDGLLDVRVVPEGDGAGALLLESLVRSREAVLEEASFGHRSPWVEIETTEPMLVNLDGEPVEGTSFRFEIAPGSLRLVLPEDSPLLGRNA